jgi:uncharacterized membrane protein
MVSLDKLSLPGARRLTLVPHRSIDWTEAKRILAILAVVTLTVAAGFAAMGFPLVLPFAGLELLAVALAFQVSLAEARCREVVSISPDLVRIERGRGRPEHSLALPTAWARVRRGQGPSAQHARSLLLAVHGREVELGRFLTEAERDVAAVLLREALAVARAPASLDPSLDRGPA